MERITDAIVIDPQYPEYQEAVIAFDALYPLGDPQSMDDVKDAVLKYYPEYRLDYACYLLFNQRLSNLRRKLPGDPLRAEVLEGKQLQQPDSGNFRFAHPRSGETFHTLRQMYETIDANLRFFGVDLDHLSQLLAIRDRVYVNTECTVDISDTEPYATYEAYRIARPAIYSLVAGYGIPTLIS